MLRDFSFISLKNLIYQHLDYSHTCSEQSPTLPYYNSRFPPSRVAQSVAVVAVLQLFVRLVHP